MKIKILVAAGCLMACMVCPAAFAQDYKKVDVFVGYSLMRAGEYDDINDAKWYSDDYYEADFKKSDFLKKGFSTSVTYNLTSTVGIATSFQYNSGYILSTKDKYYDYYLDDEYTVEGGIKKSKINFLVGPRFTFRTGRVTPFVHALVGLSHDRLLDAVDVRWTQNTEENESTSEAMRTHNSLGIAVGGGLDIECSEKMAIRLIQADYFMANHPKDIMPDYWEGWDMNTGNKRFADISLSFGLVFRIGK